MRGVGGFVETYGIDGAIDTMLALIHRKACSIALGCQVTAHLLELICSEASYSCLYPMTLELRVDSPKL